MLYFVCTLQHLQYCREIHVCIPTSSRSSHLYIRVHLRSYCTLLDALPETIPAALASYFCRCGRPKTKINLEEPYVLFDACKREKGDVIEEIISNSVDVDAKKGEVVDEKSD